MLRTTRYRCFASAFALVLFLTSANAHHDVDLSDAAMVTWSGDITEVSWDGAHVMYRIAIIDETDKHSESWELLGASPKILRSRGIFKATIHAGERVQVVGHLNRARRQLSPQYIIKANGEKFDVGFFPSNMLRQR